VAIPKAIIVPARLQSVRFPRKLLHPIQGVPLILCTARRIQNVSPGIPLYFAVGDEELAIVLEAEGYKCIRTDPSLASGTDRIAFANRQIGADFVVNVQADEPLVTGPQIDNLFRLLGEEGVAMSTLAVQLFDPARLADPSQVKVVLGVNGKALYFSRAPIPWSRDSQGEPSADLMKVLPVFGHLGLYGYRADFLEAFLQLKPSALEKIECLEQLRALENGFEIRVGLTKDETIGVDTLGDIERLERVLKVGEHG